MDGWKAVSVTYKRELITRTSSALIKYAAFTSPGLPIIDRLDLHTRHLGQISPLHESGNTSRKSNFYYVLERW